MQNQKPMNLDNLENVQTHEPNNMKPKLNEPR
jgi:hypothetical protein